jgi:hypothetical protein
MEGTGWPAHHTANKSTTQPKNVLVSYHEIMETGIIKFCLKKPPLQQSWSVVAEWLGRQTLNQRVMVSNPSNGAARYL